MPDNAKSGGKNRQFGVSRLAIELKCSLAAAGLLAKPQNVVFFRIDTN